MTTAVGSAKRAPTKVSKGQIAPRRQERNQQGVCSSESVVRVAASPFKIPASSVLPGHEMSSDTRTPIHNRLTNTQRALSDQSRNARSRSQPVYASMVAVVPIHSIPNGESGYISLGMWQARVASLSDGWMHQQNYFWKVTPRHTQNDQVLISTRQLGIIDHTCRASKSILHEGKRCNVR